MEINRDEMQHWLQIPEDAGGDGLFALMGEGVTDATVAGNATTNTTHYIHQRNGTTVVSGYAPSMAVTANAFKDDPVNEYLLYLGRTFKTGAVAKTKMVNVELFAEVTGTKVPAVQWDVDIAINNPGSGASGAMLAVTGTLYYRGDPTEGTFDTSTKTFTATGAGA